MPNACCRTSPANPDPHASTGSNRSGQSYSNKTPRLRSDFLVQKSRRPVPAEKRFPTSREVLFSCHAAKNDDAETPATARQAAAEGRQPPFWGRARAGRTAGNRDAKPAPGRSLPASHLSRILLCRLPFKRFSNGHCRGRRARRRPSTLPLTGSADQRCRVEAGDCSPTPPTVPDVND
jgi:hypothetical protein